MRQRATQVAPYARHMAQILRLAVALLEPREDAEDLGRALRRERRIDLREQLGIEAVIGRVPLSQIARQQLNFERFRHVDARVLQQ